MAVMVWVDGKNLNEKNSGEFELHPSEAGMRQHKLA